ncbi:MAG: S41 family peptidase [Steroidobacteraceae bacterium]
MTGSRECLRSQWLVLATGSLCALLGACGGGGGAASGSRACSAGNQKEFVLEAAREWYLFQDLLPATVDVDDFGTAAELLDALTAAARAEGKDRFFSFVTSQAADNSFLQAGEFIGFGFSTRIADDRLLLADVYEGSPAAGAGLARGAEITHIDDGSGFVPVATILAGDPNLETAFGPAEVGIERGLRFMLPGGQPQDALLAKEIVTILPVPADSTRILTLPSNPSVPVGYVHLRTFISTAESPLRAAYADFRAQGIQNFIVDFRNNGGGLVAIAELMGDLNGFGRANGDVYTRTHFNARKASNDTERRFSPLPQSVAPVRIAFITTGASASASELVINGMKPWAEVAIVGADTFGKPVGQLGFDLDRCDLRLRLVSFETVNADDEGDYFDGLGATLPFACAAEDDLGHEPWDSQEASTAAALEWLGTGACGQVMTSAESALAKAPLGLRTPQLRRPAAAQAWLPGLY